MDDINARFGSQVAYWRATRGYTQRELAALLTEAGLPADSPVVSRIEKGARSLRLSEALTVADVLGVPLAELLPRAVTPEAGAEFIKASFDAAVHEAEKSAINLLGEFKKIFSLAQTDPDIVNALPYFKLSSDINRDVEAWIGWELLSRLDDIEKFIPISDLTELNRFDRICLIFFRRFMLDPSGDSWVSRGIPGGHISHAQAKRARRDEEENADSEE